MAKQIKDTPILKGKDAKRFIAEQNATKNPIAIQEEKNRVLKNYNFLKSAERIRQ